MSSTPPNMPPGGGPQPPYPPPYPPYDPKMQWRIYREQQKAAWRAQRDAWKAQRYAWKAGCAGACGPRVPSIVGPTLLVAIGVVGLLIYSGRIACSSFFAWYGHWWPVLLIAYGLALLGEWALDMRRSTPIRRGSGFIGLLVLLAILGVFASGWNHMEPWFGQWNNQGNGMFNFFGMPEHDFDQPEQSQQIPANATIDIEVPHGDVTVTAGEDSNLQVQAHEVAYASTDSDAQTIFAAEKADVAVSGNTVLVKSQGSNNGRVNLIVTVPKSARITVKASWDDVTASGLGAGIDVTARGDIHLNSINGPVAAHFINGRHDDVSAHQVNGDIQLSGDCNDLTLSEIKGRVTQNGEILGDVHIENVTGPVELHTKVTDLQLASLPGDLTLDSDDLRVNEATGTVHITTHAKDVDLSQIYGDTYVENRDGRIAVEPAGAYGIEAKNSKGDVEITLPPNASATVNGRTHNGDIVTDYGFAVSGEEDKAVNGRIGSGQAHIVLNSNNGDLSIKKGPAFPATPPAPVVDTAPGGTASPDARHLKTSRPLPQQPVTQ
jgi:DUF4097 and DUF4098 domain-containing protein YvlB